MDIVELIKWILAIGVLPYFAWSHQRGDKLEKRIIKLEVMVDQIREDLKEIKQGVEKLVDRANH